MSTGNMVYLLMTIFVFVAFAGTLAYYSRQQNQMGPEMLPAKDAAIGRAPSPEPAHAATAIG